MATSKKYKISIITPIRNSEFYLEKCLRSLLKQKFESIQYIFINDASQDNSLLVLNKIINQYPSKKEDCIIISQNENKGISYCRKLGMEISSGEFIAFCDSDDYVESDLYLKLYQKAEKSDADIVTCGYFIEGENTKIIIKPYGYNAANIFKNIYGKCEIALWDKLFKKEFLIKNKVLPLEGYNYYEDCFITIKAIYFAKKIESLPNPLYHYVDRKNSSSKKNISDNLKSMNKYIKELEFFFKEQKTNPAIYETLIQRLKFQYKLKLKDEPSITRKEWNNIYKESHSKILKFNDIPFLGRLKLYFLIKLGIY